jgi:peptidyl-prolyl cis-trans isomerase C
MSMKIVSPRSVFLWALLAVSVGAFADEIDLTRDLVGNGEVNVPLAALDAFLNRSPLNGQIGLLKDEDHLKEVVARYYYDRMIADDAREMGLDKDPVNKARIDALVNRELTEIRKAAMDKEPVPDMSKLAEEHYKAHPEEFTHEAQVHVAHIMIGYGEHSPNEAKAMASKIADEIKQGGNFDELVESRSEDPSKSHNHGDLGWQERTRLAKPFADAAFALKKTGDISPVVQTKYGFHIIKLLDKRPAGMTPYAQVRDQLIAKQEQAFRSDRWFKYLDSVRNEYEVGIEQKVLDAYRNDRLEKLLKLRDAMSNQSQ